MLSFSASSYPLESPMGSHPIIMTAIQPKYQILEPTHFPNWSAHRLAPPPPFSTHSAFPPPQPLPRQPSLASFTSMLLGLVVGAWKPAHICALAYPSLCGLLQLISTLESTLKLLKRGTVNNASTAFGITGIQAGPSIHRFHNCCFNYP